jgi:integrase
MGRDGTPRRSFVFRYKFQGRTREAGLGAYPAVSLAEARDRARDGAALKAKGIDPLAEKAKAKADASIARATFEQASDALLKHLCDQRADTRFPLKTARQWRAGFKNHVFPKIGKIDVRELRHAHIAGLLAPLANGKGKTKREAKGGPTVAQRLRPRIERVIDFACAHGFRDPDQVNPARIELLRDVLGKQPTVVHHAAAPLAKVPAIYQRLAQERDTISNAIRFIMLTASRLREVLDARFDELDLEARKFSIPPHRSNPSPLGGRWPRSPERRHFRGDKCVNAIRYLSTREPSNWVNSLLDRKTHERVMYRAQTWPEFGPWIGFKIADMLEVVCGAPISFSRDIPLIYKEPRACLDILSQELGCSPRTVLDSLISYVSHFPEPAAGRRQCGVQEAETVLCKFKSYRNGHYFVGKDTTEIRHALTGWGSTADHLLQRIANRLAVE